MTTQENNDTCDRPSADDLLLRACDDIAVVLHMVFGNRVDEIILETEVAIAAKLDGKCSLKELMLVACLEALAARRLLSRAQTLIRGEA